MANQLAMSKAMATDFIKVFKEEHQKGGDATAAIGRIANRLELSSGTVTSYASNIRRYLKAKGSTKSLPTFKRGRTGGVPVDLSELEALL